MNEKLSDRRPLSGLVGNRSGDKQIDPGYHHIYQGETLVGEIFFLPLTNVEHWVLYTTYTYPSGTNDSVIMTFRFMGTPGEGNAEEVPIDLLTFLARVPTSARKMALTFVEE